MATYAYVRASTKKQEISPAVQREKIRLYCDYHQLEQPLVFEDLATSAKRPIGERDAGRKLIACLKTGDHLVIPKLDRMFRRLSDAAVMFDTFERIGVRLHVCDLMGGAIDLGSPMGRFIIQVLVAFAELERKYISERTREALQNRAKRGLTKSGRAKYGFRFEERRIGGKMIKVPIADMDERKLMNRIVQLRHADPPWSWYQIALMFLEEGRTTKEGRNWSVDRVRRAYRRELQLRLVQPSALADNAGGREVELSAEQKLAEKVERLRQRANALRSKSHKKRLNSVPQAPEVLESTEDFLTEEKRAGNLGRDRL